MDGQWGILNFHNRAVTRQSFDNLEAEEIEEIHGLLWTNELLGSFHRFNNLQLLHVATNEITDEFVFELQRLISIREIHIHITNQFNQYSLTHLGVSYFSSFDSLEIFHIFIENNINIDDILQAVALCNNLKKIYITSCRFTEVGILSLMHLPNLQTLDVSFSSSITDSLMAAIVMNSLRLENLIARRCINLTNDFLQLANFIKNERQDVHPLRIVCMEHDKMDPNIIDSLSPLIILVKNNFIMD